MNLKKCAHNITYYTRVYIIMQEVNRTFDKKVGFDYLSAIEGSIIISSNKINTRANWFTTRIVWN